jgi:hypothetical protein
MGASTKLTLGGIGRERLRRVVGRVNPGEPEALTLTAHRLVKEYGDSTWVKKASVWLP